jgi:hypothetical protein
VSELPSSEDLDPSTGTDAPTPPTTTGPSSYTLNWEEPHYELATEEPANRRLAVAFDELAMAI